jgi:hypothetical protein
LRFVSNNVRSKISKSSGSDQSKIDGDLIFDFGDKSPLSPYIPAGLSKFSRIGWALFSTSANEK